MGYRSDVTLMAVFRNSEQHDEVMAVYRMDTRVQEHNLESVWRRVDMTDGTVVRVFEGNDIKWYENYLDVQGLNHLEDVMQNFARNRGFCFAWGKVVVGEDFDDNEDTCYTIGDANAPDSADSADLTDVIYDNLALERRIRCTI